MFRRGKEQKKEGLIVLSSSDAVPLGYHNRMGKVLFSPVDWGDL